MMISWPSLRSNCIPSVDCLIRNMALIFGHATCPLNIFTQIIGCWHMKLWNNGGCHLKTAAITLPEMHTSDC